MPAPMPASRFSQSLVKPDKSRKVDDFGHRYVLLAPPVTMAVLPSWTLFDAILPEYVVA